MKHIRYRNSTIFLLFGIAAVALTCCRYNNTSDSEKSDLVLNKSSSSRAIENINYFADSGRGLFVRMEKKDSLISIYEFIKKTGQIRKCATNEKNGMVDLDFETYGDGNAIKNVEDTVGGYEQTIIPDGKHETDSLFSYYHAHLQLLDSATFWHEVGSILDSFTLLLPRDQHLLDAHYPKSKYEKPTLIVNALDFDRNITLKELKHVPRLLFDVKIDQTGRIKAVEYNSWGGAAYGKFIDEVKDILLTKSIPSYKILRYPVNGELQIQVVFKSDKLP